MTQNKPALMHVDDWIVTITYPPGRTLVLPRSMVSEAIRRLQLKGVLTLEEVHSDLERAWLDYLEQHNYNLPSHAQKLIDACSTHPDFLYEKEMTTIYIDGYHHFFPERQMRDHAQTSCMENYGYTVIRFGLLEEWPTIFRKYPNLFGINKYAKV